MGIYFSFTEIHQKLAEWQEIDFHLAFHLHTVSLLMVYLPAANSWVSKAIRSLVPDIDNEKTSVFCH